MGAFDPAKAETEIIQYAFGRTVRFISFCIIPVLFCMRLVAIPVLGPFPLTVFLSSSLSLWIAFCGVIWSRTLLVSVNPFEYGMFLRVLRLFLAVRWVLHSLAMSLSAILALPAFMSIIALDNPMYNDKFILYIYSIGLGVTASASFLLNSEHAVRFPAIRRLLLDQVLCFVVQRTIRLSLIPLGYTMVFSLWCWLNDLRALGTEPVWSANVMLNNFVAAYATIWCWAVANVCFYSVLTHLRMPSANVSTIEKLLSGTSKPSHPLLRQLSFLHMRLATEHSPKFRSVIFTTTAIEDAYDEKEVFDLWAGVLGVCRHTIDAMTLSLQRSLPGRRPVVDVKVIGEREQPVVSASSPTQATFDDWLAVETSVDILANLVVASYTEDRLGVVQNDLAAVLMSLLAGYRALSSRSLSIHPAGRRSSCGSVSKPNELCLRVFTRALYAIVTTFYEDLTSVPLPAKDAAALQRFCDFAI
eukprot:Rmarinus@m.7642